MMENVFLPHGEVVLSDLIREAKAAGRTVVRFSGNYEMSDTVFLPSDTTLILEDCRLRMAENTFCPMFRNAGYRDGESNREADADRNISILGVGIAELDGGVYNGLSERNSLKNGMPHISMNNTILFVNVRGFSVCGIRIVNQRWWAMNFLFCSEGLLRDLAFYSDDTTVDPETGAIEHRMGEVPYEWIRIKNSDGIDLRAGCHDILIDHVTGFTEDDTVALTALPGVLENMYAVEDADWTIRNVLIRNVVSTANCSNVRLLNQGGLSMKNIVIDGVIDVCDPGILPKVPHPSVRVGDTHLYGSRYPTADEISDIVIKNVKTPAHRGVEVCTPAGSVDVDPTCTVYQNGNNG